MKLCRNSSSSQTLKKFSGQTCNLNGQHGLSESMNLNAEAGAEEGSRMERNWERGTVSFYVANPFLNIPTDFIFKHGWHEGLLHRWKA